MKTRKSVISVAVEENIYEKLKMIAKNDRRSLSSLLRIILEDYITMNVEETKKDKMFEWRWW